MQDNHIPGLLITVATSDSLLYQGGYGLADRIKQRPVTSDTRFKLASVTKTFTALAVLNLISKGKISLNTPVQRAFPDLPITNPYRDKYPVCVHHLLEHTAGFDDMHFAAFVNSFNRRATAKEEVLAHENALTVRWRPGLVHSYSNPGYAALGYIIESVTGKPYQAYIRENILLAAKMKNTTFPFQQPENPQHPDAVGYRWEDGNFEPVKDFVLMASAAGGLHSNGTDMSRFLQLMLNRGMVDRTRVLPEQVFYDMQTMHGWFDQQNEITHGNKPGIYDRMFGNEVKHAFLGHSGGIIGFGADYIINREKDLAIAVFNNGEASNREVLNYLADQYLPAKELFTLNSSLPRETGAWAGNYLMKNSRNQLFRFIDYLTATIRVRPDSGNIQLTPFLSDRKQFIAGVKRNAFREPNAPYPELYLAKLSNQRVVKYKEDLYEPVNIYWLWWIRIAVVSSLLCSVVVIIYGIILFVIRLLRRREAAADSLVLAFPALTILLFLITLVSLLPLDQVLNAGTLNFRTAMVFITSLLVPVTTLFLFLFLIMNQRNKKITTNPIVNSLAIFSSAVMGVYFGWFGLTGLMLWVY